MAKVNGPSMGRVSFGFILEFTIISKQEFAKKKRSNKRNSKVRKKMKTTAVIKSYG